MSKEVEELETVIKTLKSHKTSDYIKLRLENAINHTQKVVKFHESELEFWKTELAVEKGKDEILNKEIAKLEKELRELKDE